jgi:choline dehydrogenase
VVLAAGAVGSPHLLLLSGVGPADDLRSAGVPVVADVPGVGAGFTDHPLVYVGFRPAAPVPMPAGRPPLHGVLHATSTGSPVAGDLELLPWLTPFSRITGGPEGPHEDELAVGVGLQREDSRGRLSLAGADPARQPRLDYRYLTEDSDRLRVRGVSGLRVVDTSVMPQVTTRGPAATAVMLGERAAELITAEC